MARQYPADSWLGFYDRAGKQKLKLILQAKLRIKAARVTADLKPA